RRPILCCNTHPCTVIDARISGYCGCSCRRSCTLFFQAIHKMEKALRDLIAKNSKEEFRGVYLESGLNPTRKSILAPASIGVYSAGNNYNPAQILRDESVAPFTDKIDKALSAIVDQRYAEMPIEQMKALIGWIRPDEGRSEHVWSAAAIAASFDQFGKIH